MFCSKFVLYASIFVIVKLARSETYSEGKKREKLPLSLTIETLSSLFQISDCGGERLG
jgi:hypothetical protein